MSRSVRHLSRGRTRRSSSAVWPMLAGAVCFAAVVAVLVYSAGIDRSAPSADRTNQNAHAGSTNVQPAVHRAADSAVNRAVTSTEVANSADSPPAVEAIVAETASAGAPNAASSSTTAATTIPAEPAVAQDPAAARLALLREQLAAGEIGPALETATSAPTPEERSRLLGMVLDAELESGELEAAETTIRRLPAPAERFRARGRKARKALAGGMMADFSTLINLIQNETSGLWEEVDGEGGTMEPFPTGVIVDPRGVLKRLTRAEETGRLNALGRRARRAALNDDMARPVPLRLVSLTRLERAVAERLEQGQPVLETMKQMAGLTSIQYIFVYPEEGEIVVGGPAEGWRYDENGYALGVESGRPVLQLDDFVTVLRVFAPGGNGEFGCSINPREENMRRTMEYVKQMNARGPIPASYTRRFVRTLQEKLGLQDVVVYGVAPYSRVARVLVEADYRMKLIGIDRLDAGPNIPSYFDLLTLDLQKNPPPMDPLRWWLTMNYQSVLHSPDGNVFELVGSSVRCQSTNQLLTAQGKRVETGKAEATNRLFAENFTRHYDELAARDPVFAELHAVFDLALVAALLDREKLAERVGWDLGVFGPQGAYQPAVYDVPQAVMSVVNHRVYNGKDIVVQVAGGVTVKMRQVLNDPKIVKASPRLASVADRGRAPELPEGRWWWDAAE